VASLQVLEADRLRKFLPHPHPRSLKSQLHLRLEGQAKVREGQMLVGGEGDGSNQDSIPPLGRAMRPCWFFRCRIAIVHSSLEALRLRAFRCVEKRRRTGGWVWDAFCLQGVNSLP